MKTVLPVAEAPALEEELSVRVQEALGELAAAAREGLLALSVGVGLGVLAELMEEEVVGVVGAKGKHDRERVAVRHCHEEGAVTLGGRRVAVERPRIRSADGSSELSLATYRHFADRDPLTRVVFERVRVDDRVHPAHQPQRQARAVGRDGFALDCDRDARGRAAVPQDHRLPRPRQARLRDRTRPRSHDPSRPRPRRPAWPRGGHRWFLSLE
jgi:hypothetical protein